MWPQGRDVLEENDEEEMALSDVPPMVKRAWVRGQIWNFDATAGKTFDFDAEVKSIVGHAVPKMVAKNGLQQQYNLINGVNALGQVLPPLIGIRARANLEKLKGKPVVIKLSAEDVAGRFYGSEIAPPLLVLYHDGDKALLTDIFFTRIVDPILSAEHAKLVASGLQLQPNTT